jgi:hypothetical protein
MPVETARIQKEADARLGSELADIETRVRRSSLLQPRADALLIRPADREIMEGSDPTVQQHPAAMNLPALPRLELDGVHLPEVISDRRVAPWLQLEALHREMEGEHPAVDRRRGRHWPIVAHLRAEPSRVPTGAR